MGQGLGYRDEMLGQGMESGLENQSQEPESEAKAKG